MAREIVSQGEPFEILAADRRLGGKEVSVAKVAVDQNGVVTAQFGSPTVAVDLQGTVTVNGSAIGGGSITLTAFVGVSINGHAIGSGGGGPNTWCGDTQGPNPPEIDLVFDADLDPATVTIANVQLFANGLPKSCGVAPGTDATIVAVTATDPFNANDVVRVVVSNGLRGAAGEVAASHEVAFSVVSCAM